MQERWCVLLGDIGREDVALAGGKGANLGDMVRAGLPIPRGFVVCSPSFRKVVEGCKLHTRIKDWLAGLNYESAGELKRVEQQIRRLFDDIPIEGELRKTILEKYQSLGDEAIVAVRSSATAEDLAGASFAGQQETLLNVSGEEALLEAIRRCWSSLYTSQAIFYRHQKGFDHSHASMAVVVQQMVNSEKSGVIFTVDPVHRNRSHMIIEAVWGLGEGIVSGAITPDHYKVDREECRIVYEYIPQKLVMFCRGVENGAIKVEVPREKGSARVLKDDELKQLVNLGNKVEEHFGSPQDIEWAIEGDLIYLLQSRPITCL